MVCKYGLRDRLWPGADCCLLHLLSYYASGRDITRTRWCVPHTGPQVLGTGTGELEMNFSQKPNGAWQEKSSGQPRVVQYGGHTWNREESHPR